MKHFRIIIFSLFVSCGSLHAHQIIASTGYANSGTPKTGRDVEYGKLFRAGGGYAVGVRVDVEKPLIWFGPSFLLWNNLTGDPNPNANSNYFQIEMGGRFSMRTRTIPALYAGVGAGYSLSHGEFAPNSFDNKLTFDGEFPTASVHAGMKTPSKTNGIGLLAELSYHFGLDQPTGHNAVGPAHAFLIQIGVIFDTLFSPQ